MTDFTQTFRRTTYPTINPTSSTNDQSGRTVLVIGASEGIGFAIAQAYAQANAAKVILSSRSQAKLDEAVKTVREKNVKGDVSSIVLDSADVTQIKQLWKRFQDEGTFIDVLILSAAKTDKSHSTEAVIDAFHFNVSTKLHMLENFKKQNAGEGKRQKILIDITSAALHAYPYDRTAYGSSKAAFSNYICHLADQVPEQEMRLVTLHPGSVFTAAASRSGEYSGDLVIWDHPSLAGHMGLWVSTPAAAFLHGRFIWANWDADELMAMKQKILDDPALLKIGITGVDSLSVQKLMAKCEEFPAPKDRTLT